MSCPRLTRWMDKHISWLDGPMVSGKSFGPNDRFTSWVSMGFPHFMFSIVCLKSCTTLKLDMNPKTSKLITYIIWPHFVHAFTSEFVKPHNLKCIFPVFETPKISSHLVCSNAQRQCPCWKFVFSLKVSKCPKMPCKETRADHFRTLVKCFFHSIFQNHFSCFLFNLCTL